MAENTTQTGEPGGSTQNTPGGSPENSGGSSPDLKEGDKVDYRSYQKVLDEKKRVADENAALKRTIEAKDAAERERQAADLKAKEDYKALAELREKENTELKGKLAERDTMFSEAEKLSAFTRLLGGHIQPQYLGLVNTAEIIIDPATGKVDEGSVALAVKNFRAKYPEVISTKKGALPAGAPAGSGGSLTYEAWLKLPAKEMVERRNEVVD